MTQPDRLREAAEWWHRQINSDPLLPDCSGTHMMGYGYCQRLAALAAPASDLVAAVEAFLATWRRTTLTEATMSGPRTAIPSANIPTIAAAVAALNDARLATRALLRAAPSREAGLDVGTPCDCPFPERSYWASHRIDCPKFRPPLSTGD